MEMKRKTSETTVQGIKFEVFADYILRGMTAINTATGEERTIKTCGYISNDLPTRKAIANAFQLGSFRK